MGGGGNLELVVFNFDFITQNESLKKIEKLINSTSNSYIPYHEFCNINQRYLFCKLLKIDNLKNYEIQMAYNMQKINKNERDTLSDANHREQFFHDSRLLSITSEWKILCHEDIFNEFFKYPYTINIGLENRCDTKCNHCLWFGEPSKLHTTDYFKKHNKITDEKFYEIVEFAKLGNSRIVFSGPGEPLYDDRIFHFVEHAKRNRIRNIQIAYHPDMLNKERFTKIIELGVNSPFYMQLRFVSNNLNIELDKSRMKSILKIAKNNGISQKQVDFRIIYDSKMFNEAFRYFLEMKEIGYEACLVNETYMHQQITKQNRYSCSLIFRDMYIFPDGSVGNCVIQRNILGFNDENIFSYGNIYKDSLHDIWFGDKHRKIAMEHINHNIDKNSICANCDSWYNEC